MSELDSDSDCETMSMAAAVRPERTCQLAGCGIAKVELGGLCVACISMSTG